LFYCFLVADAMLGSTAVSMLQPLTLTLLVGVE
jgi:hypothetical protein